MYPPTATPQDVVTASGLDGELHAWRRDDVGWRGYVCYSAAPCLPWLDWVDAKRVREA
jgi:hypothetical protein